MPFALSQLIHDLQEIEATERHLNAVISDLKEEQEKKEVWVVRMRWKELAYKLKDKIVAVYFTRNEAMKDRNLRTEHLPEHNVDETYFTLEHGIGSHFTVDYSKE